MGKATVIYMDGKVKQLDHKPTLIEAHKLVGGYTQLITSKVHGKPGITLVVNEDGHILKLPQNPTAQRFYGLGLVGNIIVLEGWRTLA